MGVKSQRSISEKMLRTLESVDRLLARQSYVEAQQLLTELNQQLPNHEGILVRLGQTYYYLNEYPTYLMYCIQINKLLPNDAEHCLALAHAYLMNARLILSHRAFRQFLARWPTHEEAGRAREQFDRLDSRIKEILNELDLSGDQGYEIAVTFEEAQVLMESGKNAASIAKFNEVFKHSSRYTAAYNNISLMQFHDGKVADAMANARRVLEIDPSNFHALSNMAHFLLLSGQADEARLRVEQLKRVEKTEFDRWVKQAEACAGVCDEEGVLAALEGIEKTDLVEPGTKAFYVYHLAAVAKLRLGSKSEARVLWEKCLALAPTYSVALENLRDLDAPPAKQNGPWYFGISHWLSRRTIDEFVHESSKIQKRNVPKLKEMIQRWLQKHPSVEHAVPILFDRGDPAGRDLAISIAEILPPPTSISLLRDFAQGRKGSDKTRVLALQALDRHKQLLPGTFRFWSRGEQIEISLPDVEIYFELPDDNKPPEATRLYIESYAFLQKGEGARAIPLLKQALELAPDSPQLLNNLSAAYALAGHKKESEALAREIVERHPDYFFARIGVANRMIDRKEYKQALELIAPVANQKRLHASEVASLYNLYAQLFYVQGHFDVARFWVMRLQAIAPQDPNLTMWRKVMDL
jgi:tetratricopeptide (TPR) repeat protein